MIETGRLGIRPYSPADLPALEAILTDATTMRFWPRPFTPDEVAGWLDRAIKSRRTSIYGRCALILKASAALIGDVGVVRATIVGAERNDLGYIVHHRYWGQGLATEAALALREHYFGVHGLDSLYANMAWDNLPSQRVAEKIGMHKVLEFNNPRNRDIATYLYAIERTAARTSSERGIPPHQGDEHMFRT
jgi:RimJ/RimL family protein N-acetyltransferase